MKAKGLWIVVLASFFAIQCGHQDASFLNESRDAHAPLYRFWRGFEKPNVQNFHQILADEFIPAAPLTHAKNGLEAYLVAMPKENHLPFIPDEYALVIYKSEEAYQKAKASPEGQAYADLHWNIFDKETSGSLVPIPYPKLDVKKIELNIAYDILDRPVDWQKGYSTFFVGLKKPGLDGEVFASRLSQHVADVAKTFSSKGLRAYVMMASEEYEIAYQNWSSKQDFETAMQRFGQEIAADAGEFMDIDMFLGARDFDNTIGYNDFVNVKFERP